MSPTTKQQTADRGPVTATDIRKALIRAGADAAAVDHHMPVLESELRSFFSPHRHGWSTPEQASGPDAFQLQLGTAEHVFRLLAKVDPYVRPHGATGKQRLRLNIPGGAELVGASPAEVSAMHIALSATNAALAAGRLHMDGFGNLTGNAEELLRSGPFAFLGLGVGAGAGAAAAAISLPNLLAIAAVTVTVHWWGICTCLDHQEARDLAIGLAALAAALALTPGAEPAAIPIGATAIAIFLADGVSGNGCCFYTTPLGSFLVPQF
jgi:hypothetical protein